MPDFKPGQFVLLSDGRKGTVRFAGQTHFQVGEWVGVELEEKTGKNDGSVQGERYFDCPMGYGMFVKPMMVTVLAQPPAPKPARKPARPNSLTQGSGRMSSAGESSMTRRRSMNAPSPSPGPRTSRPSSLVRVRTPRGIDCVFPKWRESYHADFIFDSLPPNRLRNSCSAGRRAPACPARQPPPMLEDHRPPPRLALRLGQRAPRWALLLRRPHEQRAKHQFRLQRLDLELLPLLEPRAVVTRCQARGRYLAPAP